MLTMLNMSSVADVFFQKFLENIQNYFKRKPSDVPYFIKEHLWMSAFDEAILKKIKIGESKPSSKLTLKAKWYHSCDWCDDSPF